MSHIPDRGGGQSPLLYSLPGLQPPGLQPLHCVSSLAPVAFVFPHLLGHRALCPGFPRPGSGRVTASTAEWRLLFPSVKQL